MLESEGSAAPGKATLAALAQAVAEKRDEAVQGRKASGIEETWTECEEAYLGIDDENRSEFAGAKWAKPMTMDGPLVKRANSSDEIKATAFVRLPARYVDAAAAKLGEIAIPVDAKAFSLKCTPVPDGAAEDDTPVTVDGQPVMRPAEPAPKAGEPQQVPADQPAGQTPGQAPAPVPLTVADLARHALAEAEAKAKKSEMRIYDWMVEYNHAKEMRKVIFDGARCGVGVIKGPIPEDRKGIKYTVTKDAQGQGAGKLVLTREVKPAARWIDFWNLFPDPGCGEDIHAGEYVIEMDSMLPSKLRSQGDNKQGGWIKQAITQALAEGPEKCLVNDNGNGKAPNKRAFTLWHFYGQIKRSELESANPGQANDVPRDQDSVFAIVTLINDLVVRAVVNPLDSGRFPYNVFNWRRRAGHWAGVGVAEQVRTPGRIVNAATRALLDNAGKSAGSNIVLDPDGLEPANKSWTLGGRDKLWFRLKNSTGSQNIRDLFATFQIENHTDALMKVIEYGFKLAEEQSSIPLITQGQSGDTTPDTFSGQQLQDNNANQLLRDVGFGLHDDITDPLTRGFYEWLLLDPDVPEDEKGDMQVDISGAVAMIEKAMQRMVVMQMAGMIQNPAFGIDPKKYFEQWARMNRLVPSEFQYSEEDQKKIDGAPPPKAPQVQAAEIRAVSAEKVAQSRDQLTQHKIDVDTDRDRQYNESLAARDQATTTMRLEELRLTRDLKMLDYALQERISLQDAKVRLADTTMKLTVQKELAGLDGKGPQVATPPNEPPGRAPDGEAYQA